MLIGYTSSSVEELLNRDLDLLKSNCCEYIYNEKILVNEKERPELEKMLDNLKYGDIILVYELTSLSRSTKDLFKLIEQIDKKGCNIKSLNEPWIDTTIVDGERLFTIFEGISKFNKDLISKKTKEGLENAKNIGIKCGRPKKNIDAIEKAISLYNSKEHSLKEIYEMTGVSQTSLYRYIKLYKNKKPISNGDIENIAKIRMWLRVENNNKFVRGKNKVRGQIEQYLRYNYKLEESSIKSREYIFYVKYKTVEELKNTVYDILREMQDEADYRNCFIEDDTYCDELNIRW
ncbi:MAG: recombinase family protein [Bacilli bacterium]